MKVNTWRTNKITPQGAAAKKALQEVVKYTQGKIYSGMLTDIGNTYGLSRERVRQFAVKLGYIPSRETTRKELTKHCVWCGKEMIVSQKKKLPYCSDDCFRKYRNERYFAIITCRNCGKEKKYLKSSYYRKPIFCGKKCQGIYLGNHYRKNVKIKK